MILFIADFGVFVMAYLYVVVYTCANGGQVLDLVCTAATCCAVCDPRAALGLDGQECALL